MSIKFLCPGCRHKLRAADGLTGKRVRCRRCSQTMVVPVPEATPPCEGPLECVEPVGALEADLNPPPPSDAWSNECLVEPREARPPVRPTPAESRRRAIGGPAPADDEADLETKYRRALQQLGGSALALAALCALAAAILILTGGDEGLGLLALLFCALWSLGGAALLCRRIWGLWVVAAVAVLNLLGAFISLTQGALVPALIGFSVNGGILTQAALVEQLSTKRRWSSLSARPELRDAAEQCDVAPLVRALRQARGNDLRAALAALGKMGPAAAPAVPDLMEVVLRRAPPEEGGKGLCQLCGKKLTLWNRDMTTPFCRVCFVYFSARRQDAVGANPSPSELAATVLGRIGPAARQAAGVLERVSRSPEPHLRQAAVEALRRIQADGFQQPLTASGGY